jgi:hypothetical protein
MNQENNLFPNVPDEHVYLELIQLEESFENTQYFSFNQLIRTLNIYRALIEYFDSIRNPIHQYFYEKMQNLIISEKT